MDQGLRTRLRNVVTRCRRLLEESIAQQLQGKYDIYATGKKDEVRAEKDVPLGHLTDEEPQARQDILAHFEHIKALGYRPKESLEQLIREIAFTHLNRLCAYKMMEVRDVYVGGQRFREAVSKGLKSQGFLFYLADHPDDEKRYNAGEQERAYHHFLNWLCDVLSDKEKIGVLFSPTDPANRVYPPQRVLDEVLDLLNNEELKEIWSEDETIGWVYQYFTPKELRDQARKESPAPRNSYELAFRNQFFTPRYVVEFLTDNTLGRIWYEMRKGDTHLKDDCHYMVRRAGEVFLAKGQTPSDDVAQGNTDISQEELLKQPVYIRHRPKKDPREIKILDPACGSGHFLLYCFALLLVIYEEAYDDPDLGENLHADYATKDDLRRALPVLVLRHNLHGIDIDLRATQIAGLALWLRCQRAYQEMGLKKDRPPITKSNIVCAEPMPGEKELLDEFLKTLRDDHLEALIRHVMQVPDGTRVRATKAMADSLSDLVRTVWEKMRLAGEAGSLLKIEEELQNAIRKGQDEWEERLPLFRFTEYRLSEQPKERRVRFVPGDIEGERTTFWDKAEGLVRQSLNEFIEFASNGGRYQRKLFVEDAKQGLGFIDVCRGSYDVVLMNPPFGPYQKSLEQYLKLAYTISKLDLYSMFVDRWSSRCEEDGYLGAISNRTFLTLSSYERFRKQILENGRTLSVVADLGSNVLDSAMVETCAFVVHNAMLPNVSTCFIPAHHNIQNKESALHSAESFVFRKTSQFDALPTSPYAYWVSDKIVEIYRESSSLEEAILEARAGLQTSDDFRFCRLWWEVPIGDWGWVPFAKGGEHSPFWDDIHLVVNWQDNGRELKEFHREVLGYSESRLIRSEDAYFRPGLNYPWRTSRRFAPRLMPEGCIFAAQGSAILPKKGDVSWKDSCFLSLACLNSSLFQLFMSIGVGAIEGAARSYQVGQVQRLPWPREIVEGEAVRDQLIELGYRGYAIRRSYDLSDETTRSFTTICDSAESAWADDIQQLVGEIDEALEYLLQIDGDSVQQAICEADLTEEVPLDNNDDEVAVIDNSNRPSRVICYAVGVVLGRWDIRLSSHRESSFKQEDAFLRLPVCSPGMLKGPDGLPAEQTPGEYPVRIDWDGILVDDPDHTDDIIRRVRDVLEVIWKDRADAVEKDACEILGVADLRDYFRKPGTGGFWDDHIKRYSKSRRKAPIYWLLQSSKKNYALWIYYHRLDKDILFKALLNYVEPKIRKEESRLDELRSQKIALGPAAKGAKKLDKDIDRQDAFLSELRDFEDKLRRAANLHLDPDLNDGVVLNIAPLRELVPWKEAKSYWDDLMDGKYEWSSIGKQLREKGVVPC